MDKSHFRCKLDLNTLEWVKGSSTGLVFEDWRAEISGSLKFGFVEAHSSWFRNVRIRVKKYNLFDCKLCDKVESCWNIQAAQVKCAWTHESTSDFKMFKMSRFLLILSIDGTKVRVNIRFSVNGVVFKLETGFRC